MTPVRIQRRRSKGWKMPPDTISVTRPGRWGNPYKVIKDGISWFVLDGPHKYELSRLNAFSYSLRKYTEYINNEIKIGKLDTSELKGKNLACFCPLDQPCHADILLKLANE